MKHRKMNYKGLVGIGLILAGAVLLLFCYIIKVRVESGEGRIASAQEKVDTGNALFSLDPNLKNVGRVATGSAQGKIDQGRRDVVKYEATARQLQIGGIFLILLGLGVVLYFRKR